MLLLLSEVWASPHLPQKSANYLRDPTLFLWEPKTGQINRMRGSEKMLE